MAGTLVERRTADVNGVPITLMGPDDLLDWYDRELARSDQPERSRVVHHLAAHPTVEARQDPAYAALLQRADVNVADGMGVVWAARRRSGTSLPRERVYGPDFMLAAVRHGVPRGWRHAFVGGTPDSITAMLDNLATTAPGLEVTGSVAPPFRAVTEDAVVEDLAALGDEVADVLWVGLGTPKQQIWADLAAQYGRARIIATVGAAFDFHAGTVSQAPAWMQRNGLEWAYRLGAEPRRLAHRYLVGNAVFVAGVARDELRDRRATDSRRRS